MKYIKTEDNITKTYEVEIDMDRLNEVLTLLDRDCYVKRFGVRLTEAHFENDAKDKITNMTNRAGLKENEVYQLGSFKKNQCWYHGQPYDVDYKAVYKDSVELVKMIEFIIEFQDEDYMHDSCINYLELINNYGESMDFIPFDKRIEVAKNKVDNALKNNNEGLMEALTEYANSEVEAKLNPNYNFQRLAELYIDVLKCIKYNLVEERIKYTR